MIIGITGGTGCGKSTLLRELEKLGSVVFDCDAIYHELLKTDVSLLKAIENRFPGTVENGILQRKRLGNLVFSDKNALEDLNNLTHATVKAEVLRQLDGVRFGAIDAIGLFQSGLAEQCDITVAVTAPLEQRIQRLMNRENISREYAESRIAAQPADSWFENQCNYTLTNDSTVADFQSKCLAFFQESGIIKV